MYLFNKFSNKFPIFLSHLLAIYMFHLDSVLSERFLWMPLFFDFPGFCSPPLDSSIFHTRTPLAFPAVIQCISACSQLIAAQQLIVITDTCGTPTLWGVFPHRGKSPANSRITLNPPMNATDPPSPPHTHKHTHISLTGCSEMPFVCLRFWLSLDVLWLWCVLLSATPTAPTAPTNVVICVNLLVECPSIMFALVRQACIFFILFFFSTLEKKLFRGQQIYALTCCQTHKTEPKVRWKS